MPKGAKSAKPYWRWVGGKWMRCSGEEYDNADPQFRSTTFRFKPPETDAPEMSGEAKTVDIFERVGCARYWKLSSCDGWATCSKDEYNALPHGSRTIAYEMDGKPITAEELDASQPYISALDKARAIVNGDREESYGHPRDNFDRIARIWSVILGIDVTPEQVGWCMVGLKAARDVNRPHVDNIVDAIGYLACIERIRHP